MTSSHKDGSMPSFAETTSTTGSARTFLSARDLDNSFGATEGGSVSVEIIPNLGEAGEDVSDAGWLKRISPLEKWEITYTLDDTKFRGGSQWKDPKDEARASREAWASCWKKSEDGMHLHIWLGLTFTIYSESFEIEISGIDIENAPTRYKETVDMDLVHDRTYDLDSYCDAISKRINEAGSKVYLGWMTASITASYEALIEKVVSATMKKVQRQKKESAGNNACPGDSICQQ